MSYNFTPGVIRYFHPLYSHPGVKISLRYLHAPCDIFTHPLLIKAIYDRHIIYNCWCTFSPFVYFQGSEYSATIYPPPLSSSMEVIVSSHDISTPLSSSMGVIVSSHNISTPTLEFHESDCIKSQYIHPHTLVSWEWLYQATIYLSPPPPPPHTHTHSLVPWEWLYHATISTPTL